ncbi:hypothetical protein BVG19_g3468 [[Candida] boidinii]|nr:hypothetical protein BVG19_g3468 [[Candida] boidinii]OWB52040.1 hypothetical protein B5S27_g3611 [[Candida] boidinii]OWB84407.1 hypothetical protein B5S33_g3052 [[Candida] boidinii]
MICNISGQPTLHPVVSPKSGKIFDKDLIIEYININGKDPITNEPLDSNELIELNQDTEIVTSRPLNTTSIPSLLSIFQNEFNSIVLENFELKKNLNDLRKELSISLYKYDSSIKVISKLMNERDELKKTLQDMAIGLSNDNIPEQQVADTEMGESNNTGGDDQDGVNNTDAGAVELTKDYIEQLNEAQKVLFQNHKKEKIKFDVKSIAINSKKIVKSKDTDNKFKLLDSNSDFIARITVNNKIIIENQKTGESHELDSNDDSGEITKLKLIDQDLIYINSNNSIKLIRNIEEANNDVKTIEIFKSDLKIYDFLVHPLLFNLIIIINENGCFSLIDTNKDNDSNLIYRSAISEKSEMVVSGCDIHGDGLLLGIGDSADNSVHVFDITTGKEAINFKMNEEHKEILETQYDLKFSDDYKVQSLKFSTNGYSLFVSYVNAKSENTKEDIIVVFDLRKSLISSAFKLNDSVNFWQIDKSSNLLITITQGNRLVLHKYVKNGKKWVGNCHTTEIESNEGNDDDKVIGLDVENGEGLINATVYLNNGSLQSFEITN